MNSSKVSGDTSPGKTQLNGIKEEETQNPKLKCPICLAMITNRAVTDTCLHEFCFSCVFEWTKNHTRCPQCRHQVHFILYNFRSNLDFDSHPVQVENPVNVIIKDLIQTSMEEILEFLMANRDVVEGQVKHLENKDSNDSVEQERERLDGLLDNIGSRINQLETIRREVEYLELNWVEIFQELDDLIRDMSEQDGSIRNQSLEAKMTEVFNQIPEWYYVNDLIINPQVQPVHGNQEDEEEDQEEENDQESEDLNEDEDEETKQKSEKEDFPEEVEDGENQQNNQVENYLNESNAKEESEQNEQVENYLEDEYENEDSSSGPSRSTQTNRWWRFWPY